MTDVGKRTCTPSFVVAGLLLSATSIIAQTTLPAQWHQRLTDRETTWVGQIVNALRAAPEFPKLAAPVHLRYGVEPEWQINAWEQNREITVPVEMIRFLQGDTQAFAFLIAHEAGHAIQEQKYGQSCYTAANVEFSKFDWFRTLTDVAGATIQGFRSDGGSAATLGAANALAIAQKQACEDNADAWAVRLMRQTRGGDASGGIRLFNKLMEHQWQSLSEQFTSDHSIDLVRIGHVIALIRQQQTR